jgi:hypothetical protein
VRLVFDSGQRPPAAARQRAGQQRAQQRVRPVRLLLEQLAGGRGSASRIE